MLRIKNCTLQINKMGSAWEFMMSHHEEKMGQLFSLGSMITISNILSLRSANLVESSRFQMFLLRSANLVECSQSQTFSLRSANLVECSRSQKF